MPEKVVKAGEEFEHLLEYMDKTPILWEEQMCGDLSESFVKSEENMMAERVHSIAAAFQIQDLKKAEYFLRFLPWEEEQKMQSYYEILDGWAIQYQPYLQEVLKKFTYVSSYLVLQEGEKNRRFFGMSGMCKRQLSAETAHKRNASPTETGSFCYVKGYGLYTVEKVRRGHDGKCDVYGHREDLEIRRAARS